VNISELFIRRPITTTLVTAAILLSGSWRIARYRERSAEHRLSSIQVTAFLPAQARKPMASAVAIHSGASSRHRGHRIDELDQRMGYTNITGSLRCREALMPRPGHPGGHFKAAQKQLPPNMPTPPSYQKVNPATSRMYVAVSSPTLPLYQVLRLRRHHDGAADLDGGRCTQVQVYGRSTRARASSIPTRCHLAGSESTSAAAISARQCEPPHRHIVMALSRRLPCSRTAAVHAAAFGR